MLRFVVLAALGSFACPAAAQQRTYSELRDYFDEQRMTMFCAAAGLVDEPWLAAVELAVEGVLADADPAVARLALLDSNVYFRSRTVPRLRQLPAEQLESACSAMKAHGIQALGIGTE